MELNPTQKKILRKSFKVGGQNNPWFRCRSGFCRKGDFYKMRIDTAKKLIGLHLLRYETLSNGLSALVPTPNAREWYYEDMGELM